MKFASFSLAQICTSIIILISSLQLCSAEDSDTNWQSITLQDGGSIMLPSDFAAIVLDFGSEKSTREDTTTYSQRLLKARGVSNNVVCAVDILRIWKESADGNAIIENAPQEHLQKYTQKHLDSILSRQAWTQHAPLASAEVGNNQLFRYSLLSGDGESRTDVFSYYHHGFLFVGSATYNRSEEKYWSSTFTDILETWKVGDLQDTDNAASDTSYKNTSVWQDHELDGGTKIWLPNTWLCIYKNAKPEIEEVSPESYTTYFQVLMNARPSLYDGDISTFHLFRFFLKSNLSGEIEDLAAEDSSEAI